MSDVQKQPASIGDIVRVEVANTGPLSFSRYLSHALYHPTVGFYADGGAGRRRDFITSVEVGPLFGALVARAIDAWWDDAGRPARFDFVEVGAGPGTLARTVLRARPASLEAMHYVAVEPSGRQRQTHPDQITSVALLPESIDVGFVFANELLDNLVFDLYDFAPDRGWSEVRVGHDDGQAIEVLVATEPPPPLSGCDPVAPMRAPHHIGAIEWLDAALARLHRGSIVAVDYAVPHYPVAPERAWLRTYAAQQRGHDPLETPGHRDITIDVPIDQLATVQAPSVVSQADWLRSLGIDELVDAGRTQWQANAAAPDLAAIEARSRIREAEALVDADGLGGFSVLTWTT